MGYRNAFSLVLAMVLAGGVAWAAGDNRERMPADAKIEAMLADLPAAAAKQPPQSPLRQAVEAGKLDQANAMLRFRPLSEAPVPEGFPSFTPVGVIELKQYPAYRKAEGPGFWPLFQHIKAENIPMTAPVEMTQAGGNNGRRPMAFLYQSPEVGQTGPANGVEVVDDEATLAVSIGVRGRMTKALAKDARDRLEGWLVDNPEYVARSEKPFRLFGYSSPMVPDTNKYWEAQIVLEKANPVEGEETENETATENEPATSEVPAE